MAKKLIFPDFFIAGVQKCGTTSLAKYLDGHPKLVLTNPKEPSYFGNSDKYVASEDYKPYIEGKLKDDELLFDATASTVFHDIAMSRIKEKCGADTKLIFILKDPVERTISAYYHVLKHGSEKRTLDEVLGHIPTNPNEVFDYEKTRFVKAAKAKEIDLQERYLFNFDNFPAPFLYAYNSLYSKQIKKFEDYFGKKNILVLTLEQLQEKPEPIFDEICKFLGVAKFTKYPDTSLRYNKTLIPIYQLWPIVRTNAFLEKCFQWIYKVLSKIGMGSLMLSKTPDTPLRITDRLNKLFEDECKYIKKIEKQF